MNKSKITWLILLISFCLIGILGIYQSIAGYSGIKLWVDHLSKDGNLSLFTPNIYQNLTLPILVMGVLSSFASFILFIKKTIIIRFIQQGYSFSRLLCLKFYSDGKIFTIAIWHTFPKKRTELISLLLILIAGIISRLFVIDRCIEYDEAYTYIEFARHTIKWITTTYYVANNHVFSTILIHFSTSLLGNDVWAIRLPSLIMGIISIICAYLFAKKLYGTKVGLLAASLLASVPVEILYTTEARGYSIVACMGLCTFLAAIYVRQHKNLMGWFVLALAGAVGFYSVPIMLYPYGIVFTWLLINGITNKFSNEYRGLINWLKYLMTTGIITGLMALTAYLPIILNYGISYVIFIAGGANRLPLDEFITTFPDRLLEIYTDWSIGLPSIMVVLICLGILASLLFYKKATQNTPHISTQLSFFVFMTAVWLVQKPYILERIMLWVIPLLLIWCASGWWVIVEMLHEKWAFVKTVNKAALANTLMVIILFMGGYFSISLDLNNVHQNAYESKDITLMLEKNMTDKDIVVMSDKCDAPFWYYFDYYGLPQSAIRNIKARPFKNAYIIISDKELLEGVINNNELINKHLLAEKESEVYHYPHFTIYKIAANKRAQIKSFPTISQTYWE